MRTVSLLAILVGSSIAYAQTPPVEDERSPREPAAPVDPTPTDASAATNAPDAPAATNDPDAPAATNQPAATSARAATEPPVQVIDADLPPQARVVPLPTVDPRALPAVPSADDEYIVGGRRSPAVAFAFSGGTTVAGIVMIAVAASRFEHDNEIQAALGITGAVALTVGPTAGHIYVGKPWNAGLDARLGSLGIAATGAFIALATCPPLGGKCSEGGAAFGGAVFLGGGLTYLGAMVYEIVDAPRAASRYNDGHRASVMVVPSASASPGLSVVGTF